MSNDKHYPTHPGAEHPPTMCMEIPVEEYESLKRENAELKDKCQMHDFFWEGCGFAKRGFKNTIAVSEAFDKLEEENAELKAKLESEQASMYADVVDANMENRKLKRALWIARACSAEDIANHFATIDEYDPYNRYNLIFCVLPSKCYNKFRYAEEWKNIFQKIKDRCRAKAEEYK